MPRSRRCRAAASGGRPVEPVLGLAQRTFPSGVARPADSSAAGRGSLAGLGHGAGPQLERAQRHRLLLVGQVAGDGNEVVVDRQVGLGQCADPLVGEAQGHTAAVGVLLAAVHQAAGDQAVDHGGDRRTPHGQSVGQPRSGGRTLGEDPEDPVLRERQVDRGQRDLDPLGEPCRDAAVRPEDGGGAGRLHSGRRFRAGLRAGPRAGPRARRRGRGWGGDRHFDHHTVRKPNYVRALSHSGSSWRRNRSQRCSSSDSPMAPAASFSEWRERRKPRLGSWCQRT